MIPNLILSLLPLVLPAYVVRFHVGPFPTTLLEISVAMFLAAWTYARGTRGWSDARRLLHARGWAWPISLWLIAGAVGVIVAADHVAALGLWRAYFLEPALVFAMLTDLVRDDAEKKLLLRSTVVALVALAAWAVVQATTGYGIPSPWNAPPAGIRATGPFPYPNALALFAVPAAALCAFLAINHHKHLLRPHLAWLGFGSGILAAVLAKSDGGLIALGAAAFIALMLRKTLRRPALAVAVLALIVALSIPTTRAIVTDQIFFREWSGKVRLVIWKETRAMLTDHPIFGAGLGGYRDGITPYHAATWMEIFQYPHNILLNLWSETGLIGTAAFAWILWRWWKRGGTMALPVMAAILVHGLVDVPYFKNDLAVMFWILVAVTEHE